MQGRRHDFQGWGLYSYQPSCFGGIAPIFDLCPGRVSTEQSDCVGVWSQAGDREYLHVQYIIIYYSTRQELPIARDVEFSDSCFNETAKAALFLQ